MAESEFNEITEIQMSLQLAEHQLQHNPFQEQLHLSLSLVSIARGSCKMIIRPDRQSAPSFVGALHIPADRAIMQATIALPQSPFDDLAQKLRRSAPRPINLLATLDKPLTVDYDGILFIDPPVDAAITNLAWTIPLK
ncbi:hypothetical protein N9X90_01145 [Alphaproteobacteria bacterium]|jgi:hypothetical protein|nr:hypothetical protein [Alphaproteobacteria bacterium]